MFLISSQIYFILHGLGPFESDPEGDEEYQQFFDDRLAEIHALGHASNARLFDYLDEEVFGIQQKQATAEQKRQKEFSKIQLQAIEAQAAIEDAEEGDVEGQQGGSDQQK